jgi:hypothetical protein
MNPNDLIIYNPKISYCPELVALIDFLIEKGKKEEAQHVKYIYDTYKILQEDIKKLRKIDVALCDIQYSCKYKLNSLELLHDSINYLRRACNHFRTDNYTKTEY